MGCRLQTAWFVCRRHSGSAVAPRAQELARSGTGSLSRFEAQVPGQPGSRKQENAVSQVWFCSQMDAGSKRLLWRVPAGALGVNMPRTQLHGLGVCAPDHSATPAPCPQARPCSWVHCERRQGACVTLSLTGRVVWEGLGALMAG